MAVGDAGVGGDGSFCFGGVEIGGAFLEGFEEVLGACVIVDVHGLDEGVSVADVFEDFAPLAARDGLDGGEEFADGEGFGEASGGVVEFVVGDVVVEGGDEGGDFSHGFVGGGVEAGDGGVDAESFTEEFGDVRVFFEAEAGVAVTEDEVVEAGADDDVFKAALDKELGEQGLVLDFGLEDVDFVLGLVEFFQGFDFEDAFLHFLEFEGLGGFLNGSFFVLFFVSCFVGVGGAVAEVLFFGEDVGIVGEAFLFFLKVGDVVLGVFYGAFG